MDEELVYLSLMGELLEPLPGIPNAFAPGTRCDVLYPQIYETRCRLCQRLDTDEDPDVEHILDCFFEITQELCYEMYPLGIAHGTNSP